MEDLTIRKDTTIRALFGMLGVDLDTSIETLQRRLAWGEYIDAEPMEHVIEFRQDGSYVIQHPIIERLDASLFDCQMSHWDGGDIGLRGRFHLYLNEHGQEVIGERRF